MLYKTITLLCYTLEWFLFYLLIIIVFVLLNYSFCTMKHVSRKIASCICLKIICSVNPVQNILVDVMNLLLLYFVCLRCVYLCLVSSLIVNLCYLYHMGH